MTDTAHTRPHRPTLLVPLALFGAAMMMHQLAWTTIAAGLLGGTGRAQAFVLAVFMGGMAFGAQRHGRAVDRNDDARRRLVRLALFIAAMTAVLPLLVSLATHALGHNTTLRWLSAVTLFTPATVWMGGVFPVVVRAASQVSAGDMQQRVGALGAAQSAGAIVGVLVGGLFVMPAGGVRALQLLGVVTTLGVAALFARRVSAVSEDVPDNAGKASTVNTGDTPAPPFAALLLALALVGATLLGIEVVMTRLVAIAFGSTASAFTLMLAGVLIGLALGSAWTSHVRPSRPVLTLARLQLAAPVALVLAFPLIERLAYFAGSVRITASAEGWGLVVPQLAQLGLVIAVLLAPMIAIGATLPLAAPIAVRAARGRVGTALGMASAASAAGNVIGALGTGLWLVPTFGPAKSLLALTIVHSVAALLVLIRAPLQALIASAVAAGVVATALVAGLTLDAPSLLERLSGHLRWRSDEALRMDDDEGVSFDVWTRSFVLNPDDYDAFALEHDDHLTATALQVDAVTVLNVNGKPDSSTALVGSDMVPMLMLGHLPLFFAPEAKRAFVIGWGGGTTAAAMLRHPIEHLEAVEISSAVVGVAQLFEAGNGHPRDDERLTLRVDDGRLALRTSDEQWDVIVSQPSNPWIAGMGALFTREAFTEARDRLTPGGVYAMWLPEYEQNEESVLLVLRTLRDVFAHVEVFRASDTVGEAFLLASETPITANFAAMEQRFDDVRVAGDLARAGRHSVAALLASHALDTEDVDALLATAPGPINVDAHERLQYIAPVAFFEATTATTFADAANRATESLLHAYDLWRTSIGEDITREEWADLLDEFGAATSELESERHAHWHARHSASGARATTAPRLSRAGRMPPEAVPFERAVRAGLLASADAPETARALLTRAHALRPDHSFVALRLAQLHLAFDDAPAARAVLEQSIAAEPDNPVALYLRLSPLLTQLGDAAAAATADLAVLTFGEQPEALLRLGQRAVARTEWDEAIGFFERSLAARRSNPRAAVGLARVLWDIRRDAPAALAVLDSAEASTEAGRSALRATRREIVSASVASR